MKSPFTGQEMTIQKELRTMSFRKEEFQIVFHSYKCEATGEQFEDDLFSQLNYNQLVNQYREKYTIPFPEQITAIREKYDVSAAKMSLILGFGTNNYRLYEAGEVPSQSNARLIQLVEDPNEFRRLVEICFDLDESAKEKLNRKIESLLESQRSNPFERQLERYLFNGGKPGRMTGYKMPNLDKFAEMVVFFTDTLQPWKTKMNKLLFYSDFLMYKLYGYSISGFQYRAIDMGPVPNNFNSVFEYLSNNNKVDILNVTFQDGGIGEQFKTVEHNPFHSDLFTEQELTVMHIIAERFKKTTTNEIIEFSHTEKAWIDNKDQKGFIDYTYGFELNVVGAPISIRPK